MSEIANAKREARELRAEALRPGKQQRRLERRCFWTWPLGHVWKTVDTVYGKRGGVDRRECQSCGKTKVQFWP